jgi:hydroxymethylpyrimidine/phosphomethylpyrimidine kinase
VMISESGAELLPQDARGALIELMLPRAAVVTPNLPEAQALAGSDSDDAVALARAIHELGPKIVIVTGGHRAQATDVFFDGRQVVEIPGERYPDGAAHGSGCTHSSVLAARLAWGDSPLQAARTAKRRASEAVRDGLVAVGAGTGPVDILGVT